MKRVERHPMNTFATVVIVLLMALTTAQGEPTDTEHGRYAFQTVPDGLMRLDTETGQVSLCAKRSAGWVCTAVADDRAALDAEVARLERENARLKSELAAHGLRLPDGVSGETHPPGGLDLPDDREVDRVMGFFEKVWRRLVDMVRTLQNDWGKDKDLEGHELRPPEGGHKDLDGSASRQKIAF
jgi:hypothetical protein